MGKGGCKKKENIQTMEMTTVEEQDSFDDDIREQRTASYRYTDDEELKRQSASVGPHETESDVGTTITGSSTIQSVTPNHEAHNEQLEEYARLLLTDPLNTSLARKFLTQQIARTEARVRTSDGVGLGRCVYVCVNNRATRMPYAISADCYCVFCDFFGPLIEFYHGAPQNEAALEALYGDVDQFAGLDLNFNDRARVLYCEVTVRRNVEGFPFTPLMSSAQRSSVVEKLEPLLRNALVGDNEDEQTTELEEEAVLPAEWDERLDNLKNELDDVGAMSDYPTDRLHLVFMGPAGLRRGAVLNFDDHLQLVCSTDDGRLGRVYAAMHALYTHKALDEIDFVAHPYLGFLTLSPAHLGVGLVIKVVAKLPFLSKQDGDIERTILRQHEVTLEPENQHCHSNGLMCLMNKNTLNKTEEESIIEVVSAFGVLYELEEELEATTPLAVQRDTMPVESLGRLFDLITRSESRSYTRKYLTASIVSQYAECQTVHKNGLNHCVRASAYFPESLFPRAADADCYIAFKHFFMPILYETNGVRSANHPHRPEYGCASDSVQYMLNHRDIRSYRVRFCRNLEALPFPLAMSGRDREEVERLLLQALDEIPAELEGEYCSLASVCKSIFFEEMICHGLLPDINEMDRCSGYYRSWPHARGIYLSKKDNKYPELILVILVNITDHIKVVCLDPSGKNLYAAYDRAVKMMHFLDLRFERKFAKRPGLGFLNSLPQCVGCGLRVSAKVRLVSLGTRRHVLERRVRELQFAYRGSNGAGTPAHDNEFDFSFKLNMNVSERFILLTFCQRLKELILLERQFDPRIPRPINNVFIHNEDDSSEMSSGMLESRSREHSAVDQGAQTGVAVSSDEKEQIELTTSKSSEIPDASLTSVREEKSYVDSNERKDEVVSVTSSSPDHDDGGCCSSPAATKVNQKNEPVQGVPKGGQSRASDDQ